MGTPKKGALKQDCCSLTPRFCAAATAFHPRDSCSGLRCLAAGLSAGRWAAGDASPRLRGQHSGQLGPLSWGQGVLGLCPTGQERPQFCERANSHVPVLFTSLWCHISRCSIVRTGHEPAQTWGRGRRLRLWEKEPRLEVISAACRSGVPRLPLSHPALPRVLATWTRLVCCFPTGCAQYKVPVSLHPSPVLQSLPRSRWSYSNVNNNTDT